MKEILPIVGFLTFLALAWYTLQIAVFHENLIEAAFVVLFVFAFCSVLAYATAMK